VEAAVHGELQLPVRPGAQVDRLVDGFEPFKEHCDLVPAWPQPQALEHTIELVDNAGVVAVDEHLRLTRRDLQPY
jgi:hypothetical protein